MFDPDQLRTHTATLIAVRDHIDAALPLAISNEAIAALQQLPEEDGRCREHLSMALVHLSNAIVLLNSAAIAVDGRADAGSVI